MRDEIDSRYSLHHHVLIWLKLCGHRRQSVLGYINAQHVVAACVLELLYTLNYAVQLLSMLAEARLMATGKLRQLNLNTQVQSVCSRSEILDVINSRLDLMITPSEVSVGSSRQSQVYDD